LHDMRTLPNISISYLYEMHNDKCTLLLHTAALDSHVLEATAVTRFSSSRFGMSRFFLFMCVCVCVCLCRSVYESPSR